MQISPLGLADLKRWEELRLEAYKDIAGVWTIGWGHTGTAKPGMTITEAEAERLLRSDLEWAERAVNEAVKVPLTQHQYDALVSFTFNVGAGAFRRSTLLKKLNAGDYAAVPDQLRRWNRAGGRVANGLINRRNAEVALWLTPDTPAPVAAPEPTARPEPAQRPWWAVLLDFLARVFGGRNV